MCVYSAMGDHYTKRLPETYPWINPIIYPELPMRPPSSVPTAPPTTIPQDWQVPVSRAEFEALKKDVLEMKEILKIAKKYDKDTGQPDCEMEEKIELIKKIAKLVGVEL